MLQQPNLELQLFVGFGELPGSFRDPPIEFTCNPFLFTQETAPVAVRRLFDLRQR